MTIPAAIIDLDNCISDDQWRLPFILPDTVPLHARYAGYHSRCHLDLCENRQVVQRLAESHHIIVFTSRPESVRRQTEQWLSRHAIPAERMFMRPNDNHSASVALKAFMLTKLPREYDVRAAIDDRQDVLDVYCEAGIRDLQRVYIYQSLRNHP